MNCNCQCSCADCKCKDNDLSRFKEFADVEAYVTDKPADFVAIADLTTIIQGIGNFYLYLLGEEPDKFQLDENRKKLEDLEQQYSNFMKNSFICYAYSDSSDVNILLQTWKMYLEKCSKLMLLRTDPRTANTLFPITIIDASVANLI